MKIIKIDLPTNLTRWDSLKPFIKSRHNEQRRIVAYLDGLPPIGDLRQAKVNALRELQSASGEELSPTFHYGDASQSALLPSAEGATIGRAFKGEL